jgi:hypothetical protein
VHSFMTDHPTTVEHRLQVLEDERSIMEALHAYGHALDYDYGDVSSTAGPTMPSWIGTVTRASSEPKRFEARFMRRRMLPSYIASTSWFSRGSPSVVIRRLSTAITYCSTSSTNIQRSSASAAIAITSCGARTANGDSPGASTNSSRVARRSRPPDSADSERNEQWRVPLSTTS